MHQKATDEQIKDFNDREYFVAISWNEGELIKLASNAKGGMQEIAEVLVRAIYMLDDQIMEELLQIDYLDGFDESGEVAH